MNLRGDKARLSLPLLLVAVPVKHNEVLKYMPGF